MKSKKATYVLLLLVVVIWGLILRKAASSIDSDRVLQVSFSRHIQKEPLNDYGDVDTANLLLNYRDPFGMVKADTATKIKLERVLSTGVVLNHPAINWDMVKYAGYIRNPRSKSLLAILNFNGKNFMMREGETVEKLKLLLNMHDSLKVLYMGEVGFIKLNTTNL